MRTGWVIVLSISTFLVGLVLGAVGGGLIGFGAGAAATANMENFAQAPDNVTTTFQAPATVATGSTFTMTITVANGGDKPVSIETIDVADEYLGSSQLISVTPKPARVDPGMGTREHTFNQSIAPGASAVFTFTIKAGPPGTFGGDWDVWFDGFGLETSTQAIEITP